MEVKHLNCYWPIKKLRLLSDTNMQVKNSLKSAVSDWFFPASKLYRGALAAGWKRRTFPSSLPQPRTPGEPQVSFLAMI